MDKKIHTDNSEIFETEDIDEVSEITETEDIDETEPEETDQTDVLETDEVPAKKRFWRKDNILKIIVAVFAVLIICEYTFFGVFFQTNKAKYEKAKQETQQEESSTEEKKVNIVTEEPLPTTNINDDSENEEEIERYQQEIEDIQISKDQVLKENLMLEENRTKVGELNGKIVLLTMQNKTLSEHLKELGGELNVGISSGSFIHAFRLLLAIKEGTLRGKLSNEERQKLFSLFDLIYWNYVSRLLERAPTLTKHDLEICCFLKFGLSHEELSCIFHTTSDSVTRAKGRLKGRLGISPQDDLDLFLKEF